MTSSSEVYHYFKENNITNLKTTFVLRKRPNFFHVSININFVEEIRDILTDILNSIIYDDDDNRIRNLKVDTHVALVWDCGNERRIGFHFVRKRIPRGLIQSLKDATTHTYTKFYLYELLIIVPS